MNQSFFKKPLVIETLALFLVVFSLDSLARARHLYWSIYEFDSVVHFFAGAAVALFFSWLYFFSGYFNPQKRDLKRFFLYAVLGAMLVGVSWETYELIFEQTMVQKADYPYDVMMDFIMDFLGAAAGALYVYFKELKIQKLVPMKYEPNQNQEQSHEQQA